MLFRPSKLAGVFVIDIEPHIDDRGLFARTYCESEFSEAGLPDRYVQCNTSFNVHRGTIRGMHYQRAPAEEGKLVRCTQGAIFDVVVDFRRSSETFCEWEGIELTSENRRGLFVPKGCLHGFQTLVDHTEVFYQMTEAYRAELSDGFRWDDPAFGIIWPLPDPILSPRDRSYPKFAE